MPVLLLTLTLAIAQDTDGDGVSDDAEIRITGTDPAVDERSCASPGTLVHAPLGRFTRLAAADLDDDGLDELVFADAADGTVGIVDGATDGTWQLELLPSGLEGADALLLFDHDGDGVLDVLVADASDTHVLAGPGFASASALGFPAQALAGGDVDGDGLPDLLVGTSDWSPFTKRWTGAVVLHPGAGDPVEVWGGPAHQLEAVDLDADGDLDLLVAGADTAHGLIHDGSGTFAYASIGPGQGPCCTEVEPTLVPLADSDGDGRPDLLVRQGGNGATLVGYRGLPGGAFGPPTPLESFTRVARMVDLDGDGVNDLVHASLEPLGWRRGLGGGALAALAPVLDGSEGWSVTEGLQPVDLDGDGRVDLVAATTDSLLLFPNVWHDRDGDGLSDATEQCVSRTDPTVADSDGDGVDDGSELAAGTDPSDPTNATPAPTADTGASAPSTADTGAPAPTPTPTADTGPGPAPSTPPSPSPHEAESSGCATTPTPTGALVVAFALSAARRRTTMRGHRTSPPR